MEAKDIINEYLQDRESNPEASMGNAWRLNPDAFIIWLIKKIQTLSKKHPAITNEYLPSPKELCYSFNKMIDKLEESYSGITINHIHPMTPQQIAEKTAKTHETLSDSLDECMNACNEKLINRITGKNTIDIKKAKLQQRLIDVTLALTNEDELLLYEVDDLRIIKKHLIESIEALKK